GEPRVALVPRDFAGGWPTPEEAAPLDEVEARVLDHLGRRGASFVVDVAREEGLEPSRVRAALGGLMRRGLATNDRFDPLRPGADAVTEALARASSAAVGHRGRTRLGSYRRRSSLRPDGRWALVPRPEADVEEA